jgi:hypothetical protein
MSQGDYTPGDVESYYSNGTALVANTFVKLASDTTIALITHATNDYPIGVLLDDTDLTIQKVSVQMGGIARVLLGGTATRGYFAKITSAGAAENATPANTEQIVGYFLESGTSGGYARIKLGRSAMPAS